MTSGNTVPTDYDILYGRDGFSIKHVGNTAFRTLIGCCLDEYKSLPADKRSWKNGFFLAIVTLILDAGGRFLRKEKGGDWKEVDQDAARQKVGQQFRDAARKPHILERFSLIDAVRAGMKIPYYSAYSFDWTGIVKNCRREILESNQWYRYAVEDRQKMDGGDSVESILGKMFREPRSDMQRSSSHSGVGSSQSHFSSMSIHQPAVSMD